MCGGSRVNIESQMCVRVWGRVKGVWVNSGKSVKCGDPKGELGINVGSKGERKVSLGQVGESQVSVGLIGRVS